MYQHTEKNITLNITHINPDYVDMTGETYMNIPAAFVARLLEESCAFGEFFTDHDAYELWEEMGQDVEKMAEHYKTVNETIQVSNADAIIALYEFCLSNPDENFCFDVETENTTWPIHDLEHAKLDLSGCTIYVESHVEKERILTSFAIVAENCPENLPGYEFCEKLEDEFKQRFNETLCLEEYKYFGFEEE